MKLPAFTLYAALIAAALFADRAISDDKPAAAKDKAAKDAAAPDMNEMMKKWEAAAAPGPAHKALEPLAGDWDIASKWWLSPDAPPEESKGTTKTRWILGGRYLQDDYAGDFMGKPMKGLGITGYDNLKKKYVSFWIDDGGTGLYTSQGDASADGKVFTFNGRMDDPMTGEMDKPVKFIIRILSPDKHIFEMHEPAKGEKSKVAEMTYTRK